MNHEPPHFVSLTPGLAKELIAQMQARHGTALLFVTHDLGVVSKVCLKKYFIVSCMQAHCAEDVFPNLVESTC